MTYGTQILARSLSVATGGANGFMHGNLWQYHPRSDRHSKIACWGVFFDLMLRGNLLYRHVVDGKVAFGINHRMRDFQNDRQKDLDLVICRRSNPEASSTIQTFADMISAYNIVLSPQEQALLRGLPDIEISGVQTALVALEAKAAFTEFGKARPRLYDELNSSHLTIHGDTDSAIAAGLALINAADTFISPLRNPWAIGTQTTVINPHKQPANAASAIAKVTQLPRRAAVGQRGFDAMGVVLISCANDGSPVSLVTTPPAPQPGAAFQYDAFIERIDTIYASRFAGL
ncbi:hypothetical protein QTH97_33315 [Variovorax sp. J22R24]|uniref:hypothetical protein n=1 Tax=Variovorax gracilis TaxID=3053502 RepID=UPI0025765036|nr:hypothetical protein [Variovorax sp. J22R24]MDM0109837.1 hypothetical protein [Variovorax sp. J22R24]